MIINAEDIIVGRLGTVVAKQALLGQDIVIINADKAVISGRRAKTFEKYKDQDNRGEPFHGPFLPKRPDLFLKRMIRGMLPRKTTRGREALARIKCFMGIPAKYADQETVTIESAHADKLPNFKYVSVGELVGLLKG